MIRISSSGKKLLAHSCDLLVCLASVEEIERPHAKGARSSAFGDLDRALQGRLRLYVREKRFQAKAGGKVLFQHHEPPARYVLIYGAPEKGASEFERVNFFRELGAAIALTASKHQITKAHLVTQNLNLDRDSTLALLEGAGLAEYRFTRYKKERPKRSDALREIVLIGGVIRDADQLVRIAEAEQRGVTLARDLVNTPARDCGPAEIVREARALARRYRFQCTVYDRARLGRMGANLLLAVAQGSSRPPYLVKLVYRPRGRSRGVVSLVGKGVTFDSGGLSIKTAQGMETMKIDMAGGAAVLGAMEAIGVLKPNIEVRAYIPTTENMIGGGATRPGDVVRGLSGTHVEILNTDAEGRLILADALALALREKPELIVDCATLTGACVVALGELYAGLFATNEKLAADLEGAATVAGERVWRMPLAPEYAELIKSAVGDIKNTGGRSGGAITAALFLKEFVGDISWAHLDIAGPAWSGSDKGALRRGATGFGVRTLVRFLLARSSVLAISQ